MEYLIDHDAEQMDRKQQQLDHCGSRFAIHEGNRLRTLWDVLMAAALFYTGTIFLYRLSFVQNRMPHAQEEDDAPGWHAVNTLVTVFFYVDLVMSFFFTYRNSHGDQVESLQLIAVNYLTGVFWINLLACIPEVAWKWLFTGLVDSMYTGDIKANQSLQALKMQRVTRMARLLRISRLGKVVSVSKTNFIMRRIKEIRGVQSASFLFFLLFVVHVLACGWYLCASLHDREEQTWLARRIVYIDEDDLPVSGLDVGSFEQYLVSFYFVLTVFTTVGFGDISAFTVGEMAYVIIVMIIGAIVHSMVINEVIRIIQDGNQVSQSVYQMTEVIEAFGRHTHLNERLEEKLKEWVFYHAQYWQTERYDRGLMKSMIAGKFFPRELLGQLPENLYGGRLLSNRFLACMDLMSFPVPPRLALLLAVSLGQNVFKCGELIYKYHDSAFNLMLVYKGTFAYLGAPGVDGGKNPQISEFDDALLSLSPYQLLSYNCYFGDVELMLGGLRRATVRCESANGGEVLALQKADFQELLLQFPECEVFWTRYAKLHEWTRQRRLARLTCAWSYRNFAAGIVQRQVRRWRKGQKAKAKSLIWMTTPRNKSLEPVVQSTITSWSTFPGQCTSVRNSTSGSTSSRCGSELSHRMSNLEAKVERGLEAIFKKLQVHDGHTATCAMCGSPGERL
eukprot:TRINITY_DN9254_c0_g1_i3.p1 TRINITY_DN9254_c0_g1~~TRINITY_DN9254_c0_g1_i3.p1  ORF type:complete len:726 (-),score=125.17 TRINITY_DN9254_c0_g1_i3:41-2065(-)